jgi:hypothetical protein
VAQSLGLDLGLLPLDLMEAQAILGSQASFWRWPRLLALRSLQH